MRCYWEVTVDAVAIRGGDGYGVGHCNKTYAAHTPSGRCCTAWWLMGAAGVRVDVLDGVVGEGRLPFVSDIGVGVGRVYSMQGNAPIWSTPRGLKAPWGAGRGGRGVALSEGGVVKPRNGVAALHCGLWCGGGTVAGRSQWELWGGVGPGSAEL